MHVICSWNKGSNWTVNVGTPVGEKGNFLQWHVDNMLGRELEELGKDVEDVRKVKECVRLRYPGAEVMEIR